VEKGQLFAHRLMALIPQHRPPFMFKRMLCCGQRSMVDFVSHTVTYEHSSEPSSEPLDLPELLEIQDNDDDDDEEDLSNAMEEEFFGHTKRAEPAEPKRDPVSIFTSQIDADTDCGTFRIDQSKIGCHIVKNMLTNSWPVTPSVLSQNLHCV
jgi:hypothetical protein